MLYMSCMLFITSDLRLFSYIVQVKAIFKQYFVHVITCTTLSYIDNSQNLALHSMISYSLSLSHSYHSLGLTKNTKTKLTVLSKGDNVIIPIPSVDRGPADERNVVIRLGHCSVSFSLSVSIMFCLGNSSVSIVSGYRICFKYCL
jgi:hypothetical protein